MGGCDMGTETGTREAVRPTAGGGCTGVGRTVFGMPRSVVSNPAVARRTGRCRRDEAWRTASRQTFADDGRLGAAAPVSAPSASGAGRTGMRKATAAAASPTPLPMSSATRKASSEGRR